MVVTAEWVQGLRNAYGATIAFRRQALEQIGGFAALSDHLADDYVLGQRIAAAGWRLVLLPYVVDTILDSTSLSEVWTPPGPLGADVPRTAAGRVVLLGDHARRELGRARARRHRRQRRRLARAGHGASAAA